MDRRIGKSQAALLDAFVEVVAEKGVLGFTVNDLCNQANLNRGTFYNHFKDKDEFLLALEDDQIEGLNECAVQIKKIGLKDILAARVKKQPIAALVSLFDYLREQSAVLQALLGSRGDPAFAPRMRCAVGENLVYAVLHERYRNNPTAFVRYYVSFYATAYMGVIQQWMDSGMQESSEEMAYIAVRLLTIKVGDPLKL